MNDHKMITLYSGNQVPAVGLGTWQLQDKQAIQSITEALRLGYRLVDTAGDYGNQIQVGQAIKQSAISREDICLVTKVEEDEDTYEAVRADLAELGMEYADIVLIHRPPRGNAGVSLWEGLIRAKHEGLAREIGVSNYSIHQMEEIAEATGEKPAVNQLEWSPFGHSAAMAKFCRQEGIVIMAYSPLTRGFRLDDPVLLQLAQNYIKTPAQIVLRWNVQNSIVSVPKATSKRHLVENLRIFNFMLSDEDMQLLNGLNEAYSSLGSLSYVRHSDLGEEDLPQAR